MSKSALSTSAMRRCRRSWPFGWRLLGQRIASTWPLLAMSTRMGLLGFQHRSSLEPVRTNADWEPASSRLAEMAEITARHNGITA